MSDVYSYIASEIEGENIAWINVTNPLADSHIYTEALNLYNKMEADFDCLLSATNLQENVFYNGVPVNFSPSPWPRSQDLNGLCSLPFVINILKRQDMIRWGSCVETDHISTISINLSHGILIIRRILIFVKWFTVKKNLKKIIEMTEDHIDLINYSHDRNVHYKVTADELFNLINKYTNQKELNDLYNYFDEKYELPRCIIKQTIRQYIARSYLLRSGKFNSNLHVKNILKSIFKYTALIYALFFVKKNKNVKTYKLIIDNITSSIEIDRFDKLINLIGRKNVLCVTRDINLNKNLYIMNYIIKSFFIRLIYLIY